VTQHTSSPSVNGTTSASKPGGTGRRRTGGSCERTSRGLKTLNKNWIDVLLGPVPCQGCGRPVCWVRWEGHYRFWADPGDDVSHLCSSSPVAPEAPLDPSSDVPLHRMVETWKRTMSGG